MNTINGKNSSFFKPLQPSAALAEITGTAPIARTEAIRSVWRYIKLNQLQDAQDRRVIVPDEKLKQVFGQDRANMFEVTRFINRHMS